MRSKAVILILGVLLCCGGLARATDIDFYTDGTLSTGEYGFARMYNDAVVNVTGGKVISMGTNDFSTVNVYGGQVASIYMSESSVVNLYGGLLHQITYADSSKLNVYGYNFTYESAINDGWLRGKWADGQSFMLFLRMSPYPSSQIELHEVPEPTSVAVLLGGLLALRAKKNVA